MPRKDGDILRPLIRLGEGANACWEWNGKITSNGYGYKQFHGRAVLAHRWVFQLFNGWITKGTVINHLCSNRGCVNPRHLEMTTPAGNSRHGKGSKLTAQKVAQIKFLLLSAKQGDRKRLAEKYRVSAALISDIKYGRAWRDIAPAERA